MNAKRRDLLDKARELIGEAVSIIEEVKEQEEEAYENLPKRIQNSERGEKMGENVYNLSDILSDLENSCELMMEM